METNSKGFCRLNLGDFPCFPGLTCPPEGRPLLVVGVEVLGEVVRLQQTVEQLEEVS